MSEILFEDAPKLGAYVPSMAKEYNPIITMQKNLSVLRKVNGWTTEELGTRIGVTKQTISNLENGKVSMTKTQYIALRTVFEYELRCVKRNLTLQRLMYLLFYSHISFYDSDDIKTALDNLAAAASGGVSGNQLFLLSTTLLSPYKIPILERTIDIPNVPYVWIEELEDK